MRLPYRLLYAAGVTPWDDGSIPAPVRELVEPGTALPVGRCLDVGCGSGRIAVFLAGHGWDVTGVDAVGRALDEARAAAAGVQPAPRWIAADAGDLGSLGLEPGFDLILDIGCLFGIGRERERRASAAITDLAAPGARLLRFGVFSEALARRDLDGWTMLWFRPDAKARPGERRVSAWCLFERRPSAG